MANETVTLAVAITGAICGVTGAVLGVINTLNQLRRNKVRLKVTPYTVIPAGAVNQAVNFGIEVINLSEFPMVITDVGFYLGDGRRATVLAIPGVEPSGPLPLRVEPRSAYRKYFHVDRESVPWPLVRKVYASTECGHRVYGTSQALRQLMATGGSDAR